MRPEVEQDLAHTLLVELLAYQFASPVRWIETQDVILGEKATERIVEVGPADTLGVMAKRTLAAKYEATTQPCRCNAKSSATTKTQKTSTTTSSPRKRTLPRHRPAAETLRLLHNHRIRRPRQLQRQLPHQEQVQQLLLLMSQCRLQTCCERS